MTLFVVTSKAQDVNAVGVVLTAHVRLHGVFTNRGIADGIAAKYKGVVTETVQDDERNNKTIHTWVNPGCAG